MPFLRIKHSLTLFATIFMLASGCRQASPFTVPQAMRMFYGNYDQNSQTSLASLPKDKGSLPAAGEELMANRMFFNAFIGSPGAQSFVLVTYAVPSSGQSFDCHACAPIIGMAVFSQKRSKWTMDASNRAVTFAGAWGTPPASIQLVQIGANRYAVQIRDVGGGQGESTAVLELLIPWNGTVNRGLMRIVSDAYICDAEGDGLPCYSNQRTVKFIQNSKAEYYDLELEMTGTDLVGGNGTPMQAKTVHSLETLKFENGSYVQLSRQGDVTTADRNLDNFAERE